VLSASKIALTSIVRVTSTRFFHPTS